MKMHLIVSGETGAVKFFRFRFHTKSFFWWLLVKITRTSSRGKSNSCIDKHIAQIFPNSMTKIQVFLATQLYHVGRGG
jgi:hypothetical protein